MPDHLLGHCLRCHEDSCDVDLEHGVCILGCVLERRCFLLDTCCRHESVHTALLVGDILDDLVQLRHIANIDLAVVECRTELLGCPSLNAVEVLAGLRKAVQSINCFDVSLRFFSSLMHKITSCASLKQGFGLYQSQSTCGASHQHYLIVERKLWQALGCSKV